MPRFIEDTKDDPIVHPSAWDEKAPRLPIRTVSRLFRHLGVDGSTHVDPAQRNEAVTSWLHDLARRGEWPEEMLVDALVRRRDSHGDVLMFLKPLEPGFEDWLVKVGGERIVHPGPAE